MTKDHGWILLRLILTTAAALALSFLLVWIFSVSYPFWIAALLVWMFYPLIRLLRRRVRLPNTLAVILALLLGISALVGAITGIVVLIVFGFRRIAEFVPDWIETTSREVQQFFNEQIFPIYQELTGAVDQLTPEQQRAVNESFITLGDWLAGALTDNTQGMTDGVTQLLFFVPASIVVMVFVFIAFYFIGKDWEVLYARMQQAAPPLLREKSLAFKKMFQYRVFGFLRAQVVLMLIASVIVFIGLLILQVEQAFTIALIVGLAEILPYFGSGTILIPWLLYAFFTGDISMGIGLAVVYAVTVLIRQSIEPKVLSTSMNLNALAVLIALFVGFQILGVVGVFIGPFVLVILVILKDIGVLHMLYQIIRYGLRNAPDDPARHGRAGRYNARSRLTKTDHPPDVRQEK
ncbi:sporulation integral membrane protein YtvI [Alkalicoccus chagannorensis]|uniref:sporulation integral membrane protein YtvI n=1 Tax=Alkalicoccus chagannorensis TaxID=427072 RepID=UPI0004111B8B|nr:sporulation integral membrane protein YtvI [Alkalicoccus chagannorensis]